MFCTECGKQIEEGAAFCTECGTPVLKDEELSVSEGPAKSDADQEAIEEAPAEDEPDAAEEASAAETAKLAAADEEERPFDLPDSALEPSTVPMAGSNDQQDDATVPIIDAGDGSDGAMRLAVPVGAKKLGRNRVIAISSAAAVVVVAAIGILFAAGVFNPNTPIDDASFPDDVIRGAVLDQLDEDGDGRLSEEEAESVTAVVYTPSGAEFATKGEDIDVPAMRASLEGKSSGSEASASDTRNADGAASLAGSEATKDSSNGASVDDGLIESFASFPNLKHLIASDSDLRSIDLSGMSQLEYVDLRGNPDLTELDLSGNPNIRVLFCDADVRIAGLEEAGLYYTDLVSSMEVSEGSGRRTIEVEYDSHARPISAAGVDFAYDDEGRLIEERQSERGEGAWYESFSYGANGLLASASSFWALDISTRVREYAYGYDDQGRLTQMATGLSDAGAGKAFDEAGVFEYDDAALVSYKGTDASTAFIMDEEGLLVSACMDDGDSQTNVECAYGPSGAQEDYHTSSAFATGSTSMQADSAEYSEEGVPTSSQSSLGSATSAVTYECNPDGYITAITWTGTGGFPDRAGRIGYVKRVGSLADRASERYVPVIRPGLKTSSLYGETSWNPLDDWFSTTADETPITMLVEGPFSEVNERLGLRSSMLYSPNEVMLASYDREHRMDGLTLSGAQPIEEERVAELLADAAQAELPVAPSAFVDDPVYGPIVEEFLRAAKGVNADWFQNLQSIQAQYPNVPPSVLQVMAYEVNPGGYSAFEALDFAFVDLDSDGANELAVTFPRNLQYPSSNSVPGESGATVMAIYGTVDGKAELITSAAERLQCWVTPSGDIVSTGGGGTYESFLVKRWDGRQLQDVGGFDYMQALDADSPTAFELTLYSADGTETTSLVSSSGLASEVARVRDANLATQLNWVAIPCD